eukprot:SAG25_NODE_3273_length_1150_cov_0.944814_1_plen_169_part_00
MGDARANFPRAPASIMLERAREEAERRLAGTARGYRETGSRDTGATAAAAVGHWQPNHVRAVVVKLRITAAFSAFEATLTFSVLSKSSGAMSCRWSYLLVTVTNHASQNRRSEGAAQKELVRNCAKVDRQEGRTHNSTTLDGSSQSGHCVTLSHRVQMDSRHSELLTE